MVGSTFRLALGGGASVAAGSSPLDDASRKFTSRGYGKEEWSIEWRARGEWEWPKAKGEKRKRRKMVSSAVMGKGDAPGKEREDAMGRRQLVLGATQVKRVSSFAGLMARTSMMRDREEE